MPPTRLPRQGGFGSSRSRVQALNRLEESNGGASVLLTAQDLTAVDVALSAIAIQGDRIAPPK
jgi:hypothetical protein